MSTEDRLAEALRDALSTVLAGQHRARLRHASAELREAHWVTRGDAALAAYDAANTKGGS